MRRQKCILFLVLTTFFSAMVACSPGCNSIDDRYYLMLDTLDNRLAETRELLAVDYATIQSRHKLVEDHLRLIDIFLKDSISPEFGMQLSKYTGLKKVYARFLSSYTECLNEMNTLVKQASDLRAAVNSKELSKEEFKEYYAREKEDGLDNLNRSRKLIKPVHAVEPDYQRISRKVDEKLSVMAKSDSTLLQALIIANN